MILLIGSEKGGSGKSTVAVNLAAMRAAGRDVLLIDADKQGSAQQWYEIRTQDGITPAVMCVCAQGNTLASQVRAMALKFDDVIIDAGGRDSVELRSAMTVADRIITPAMPSQFDIFTLSLMDRLVGEARAWNPSLRASILVNGAPTNPSMTDEADMREYVADLVNYDVMATTVRTRKAYRRCAQTGQAAPELATQDEKATAEMIALAIEAWQ